MAQSPTPNSYVQSAPSGFQLGQQQMAQFADQPNSLAAILSGINALTTPTKSPDSPSLSLVLNGVAPATHTGAGAFPTGGAGGAASGAPPSTASTLAQYAGLGKTLGGLGKTLGSLSNILGGASVPTGMAGTALGGAGLPSGLTAAQQANLTSAFTGAPVAGSLADAMGLTAGSLSPLAASALAPVGTGAITAAGNAAGASAASELASALGTAPATAAPAAAAAAPAASASGLGATAGALGAAGLVLAPMLAGILTPAVTQDAQWWSGLQKQANTPGNSLQSQYARAAGQGEVANMINGGARTPYSSSQLGAMGITPQVLQQASAPVTSRIGQQFGMGLPRGVLK